MCIFFFQAEDGIRDGHVTGVQTCALPISHTNLALALEIEPELPRLLKRLHIMGGAINHRGNTGPTSEWNIAVDPEAAQRVLRSEERRVGEGGGGRGGPGQGGRAGAERT